MRVAGARQQPMRLQKVACVNVSRRSMIARSQEETRGGPAASGSTKVEEVQNIEAGNISPEKAEKRADLGANWNDPAQIQAFDGPAPETINGRLSMLAVVIALGYEWFTGLGIREQVGDHPVIVLAVFVLISLASFIPITRGYTRKEAFANGIWQPKAENWNGRLAMLGFTGMILTEALSGMSTLQWWGLQ